MRLAHQGLLRAVEFFQLHLRLKSDVHAERFHRQLLHQEF